MYKKIKKCFFIFKNKKYLGKTGNLILILLFLKIEKPSKDMGKYVKNIKVAKNLPKGSLTPIVDLYLTMFNVNKKFQSSIFKRS